MFNILFPSGFGNTFTSGGVHSVRTHMVNVAVPIPSLRPNRTGLPPPFLNKKDKERQKTSEYDIDKTQVQALHDTGEGRLTGVPADTRTLGPQDDERV